MSSGRTPAARSSSSVRRRMLSTPLRRLFQNWRTSRAPGNLPAIPTMAMEEPGINHPEPNALRGGVALARKTELAWNIRRRPDDERVMRPWETQRGPRERFRARVSPEAASELQRSGANERLDRRSSRSAGSVAPRERPQKSQSEQLPVRLFALLRPTPKFRFLTMRRARRFDQFCRWL